MNRFAGLALAASVLAAAPRAGAEGGSGGSPPIVTAPPPSAEAARADRLFAAGRWDEAAVAYHRVARGETREGARARRVAGYRVAVALHYLGLHQASLGAFAEIADDPGHPRFGETLVWLAGLSTVLPEPDEVVALLGRYGPGDAAVYDNPTQRPLHARLLSLLGRHAYQARRFDEAIRAFEKVGPEGPGYVEAEFLTALAHVQLRKPAPAIRALERLRAALSQRGRGPERTRLLDLVHLATARIQYSSARVGLVASCCGSGVDRTALQAAFESYGRVDPGGPSWPVALFESSWVGFMAGDPARALGNLRAFDAPAFQGIVNPEVPVLQGMIAFSLCHYDAADGFGARTRARFGPVRREIAGAVARLDREGGAPRFFRFAGEVRAGAAGLGADARTMVTGALADRQIQRRFAHARAAGEEIALLARMPAAFRSSALGGDTADALDVARDVATRSAGALVRARLVRAVEELDQRLRQAGALSLDVARMRSVTMGGPERTPQPPPIFSPDVEHVIWPFDGEFWTDEMGDYRVPARSRCVR